ncbi:MAG: hypothetical protein K2O66_04865 [Bacteroidales bacterium]|nr:hypothetical protein [Bacteroidales bacterium]
MAKNRAGRIKICLWAVFFSFLLPVPLCAQTGMLSPYSAFGAGSIQPYLNVRNMAMGGLAVGLSGPGDMNPFNPASYRTGVDTLSVRFDIGFNIGMNRLRQKMAGERLQNQSTAGGLSNLEFYFPVCKWYKMAVYLLPVTNMYYRSSFMSDAGPGIGQTQLIHEGDGGLSNAGWGHSLGWGPVSVGVNLSYMFGSLDQTTSLVFLDDTLAYYAGKAKYYTETKLNGFALDAGITYAARIKNSQYLTLGAVYSMSTTLYGKRTVIAQGEYSSLNDTAFWPEAAKRGKVIFPSMLRAGISYEQRGQYVVGADFTYVWWKEYKDYGHAYDYLKNTFSVNVGAELKHDPQANSKARRVAYRIGGFYQQQCVADNGKQLQAFGISLGVGIPVRKSRSIINVGLQYGRIGALNKGQIQEDYLRIGVSFASVETWFVKPRYD